MKTPKNDGWNVAGVDYAVGPLKLKDADWIEKLEADLQRQIDRTRRVPTEPLVSLRADDLRALFAAAKERDNMRKEVATAMKTADEAFTSAITSANARIAELTLERDAERAECDMLLKHVAEAQLAEQAMSQRVSELERALSAPA